MDRKSERVVSFKERMEEVKWDNKKYSSLG